ncbi:MAG: hypothetical protein KJ558_07985 [Gammaproteobacteria bacterium]|nr:hypothetical protein [Gammaproteobacteria bacterium]MBU1654753.1 hypothetical protein [Gammaproteobacteria bacterium]MBU1961628.1 hypothetical protein [Gammaproteobacteria bacterium]
MNAPRFPRPNSSGDETETYVVGMDLLLSLSLFFLIIIVLNVNGILINALRAEGPSLARNGKPPLPVQVSRDGGRIRIGGMERPPAPLDEQAMAAIRQQLRQQGTDRIALALPANLPASLLHRVLGRLQAGLGGEKGAGPAIELLVIAPTEAENEEKQP